MSTLSGEDHRGTIVPLCCRWGAVRLHKTLSAVFSMWKTLILTIAIGTPIITIASIAYANILLSIARVFGGWRKETLALLCYVVFIPIFVSPLFYLLIYENDGVRESTPYFLSCMLGFVLTLLPSIYYFYKSKFKELRNAGYF